MDLVHLPPGTSAYDHICMIMNFRPTILGVSGKTLLHAQY